MLTFSETRQRTLNTSDEIAAYLGETFRDMQEASTFKTGDPVAITSRSGLTPEIGVGDVGIMLCDLPNQLFSWVLVFTSGGQQMAVQIQTANLAKREPAAEASND
ncbi:hypothetical protein LNAOJCKE_4542 [Methylorubrum aminovorans]|uniref:Uncharacterized protein n=1 Tax=Methylorubrum aminovorans TaxID=269069 RepID=A0ABQ4UKT4_9HYPH|nr:hypothetical protein [Methylorubrum aminovorans]GJE67311.1 hypothetical protein LNAOJCKE_4542 [Methylorubrum aminovorans]GMA74363.1 hypothetical protein GCM10025880_07800 [Methylorubrum aminovorans]